MFRLRSCMVARRQLRQQYGPNIAGMLPTPKVLIISHLLLSRKKQKQKQMPQQNFHFSSLIIKIFCIRVARPRYLDLSLREKKNQYQSVAPNPGGSGLSL